MSAARLGKIPGLAVTSGRSSAAKSISRFRSCGARPFYHCWSTIAVMNSLLAVRTPMPVLGLQPERIGIRHAPPFVLRTQRRHSRCFVEPGKSVELLCQRRLGVVAHQLGLGAIDHTDKPF